MMKLSPPQQHYSPPWKASYEVRMMDLRRSNMRAAYFCDEVSDSTFRYRVYNMIQSISQSNLSSGAYFTSADFAHIDDITSNSDVLVVCRSRYTHQLEQLINCFKRKGKTVFFDIDDLVFDTNHIVLLLDTLNQDLNDETILNHWFSYLARLRATMDMCDLVITTNPFLSNKTTEVTGKNSFIVPNYLNREQIVFSKEVLAWKTATIRSDADFLIGYFSGSPTHDKDFKVAEDAILKLMKIRPEVKLLVVGHLNINSDLIQYNDRIRTVPRTDFINLQMLLAQADLNIVPLQVNDFTNCKSELKFFEAAIVHTPTIASKTHTYKNAITSGINGFLANSYEWYELLDTLVQNRSELSTIAATANEYCLENYHYKLFTKQINQILFS